MPFDTQQFVDVFASYNGTVFPMQVALLIAAVLAIRLANNEDSASSKTVAAILSFFWLWMGVVYHWLFFYRINGLALVFGGFFVLQSFLIFRTGVMRSELSFSRQSGVAGHLGTLFVIYALIVYPLIGMWAGHSYPYSPTFGLPCPTTIFTFGILLRSGRRIPLYVLPIPFVWSLLGSSAAYSFGIWEDLGLIVVGAIGTWFLVSGRFVRGYRTRSNGLMPKEN